MLRYRHDIEDLSSQLVKERAIVGDLNGTIDEMKGELEKAQCNLSSITHLKDALESQQQRTNETLSIQVCKCTAVSLNTLSAGIFTDFGICSIREQTCYTKKVKFGKFQASLRNSRECLMAFTFSKNNPFIVSVTFRNLQCFPVLRMCMVGRR